MNHRQEFKVFTGNANPSLAQEITKCLHINMGKSEVSKFANGETGVIIHESIRAHDVYIVQPICANMNQINFIKHAKANSNSSLNTSIRSPKAPLMKTPSYTNLIRANLAGLITQPLNLSNPLLSNLKDGDNVGFFSPELGPKPTPSFSSIPPSSLSSSSSSAYPQTPTTLPQTTPATPPHQSTTPAQGSSTLPTPPTTPYQAPPSSTLPTPPSTPTHTQPATPTTTSTTDTPKNIAPITPPTQGQTTPGSTKPLRSPRSLPTSPSFEKEKVVIMHSTTKDSDKYNWSVNDSLMELMVMGDAFKRASCKQLIAVIPFFGYARQSKKHKSRTPITAKLVANMLQTAGFDRVITVDLHASQIQGFFDIPVDNLYVEGSIVKYIKKRIPGDKVVISPGAGGVKRAKSVADRMGLDLAILHKETHHESHKKQLVLVGDVKDKVALIIDDIADTCETLERATYALLEKGATKVYALVSHGVLSDRAIERLISMPLTELIITNSIPNDYNLSQCSKIKVINIGPLLAEAIRRTNFGESLSSYFFSQQ